MIGKEAPRIFPAAFPEVEKDAVWHIVSKLNGLDRHITEFVDALTLFRFSQYQAQLLRTARDKAKESGLTEADAGYLSLKQYADNARRMAGWRAVAARDASMTIFHFGKTIEALKAELRTSPTLSALVSWPKLKSGTKMFRSHFPRFETIRNAVGHTAELTRSVKEREKNAFSGSGYKSSHIEIKGDVSGLMIQNNIEGDTFTVTINGEILSYEINEVTRDKMVAVKDELFSAFENAEEAARQASMNDIKLSPPPHSK